MWNVMLRYVINGDLFKEIFKSGKRGVTVSANLHHEQEVGGSYDDEQWAWIQTEIQRISTEQQRPGVEMAKVRNDVWKGNRINEENNQMLRNMMQHLHLQGPPYGPQ